MSVFGVILVGIFHAFSRIRTEYGEIRSIRSITPKTDTFYLEWCTLKYSFFFFYLMWFTLKYSKYYSVQMRENAGKMRTRITSNTDTFYAVWKSIRSKSSYLVRIQEKMYQKKLCIWIVFTQWLLKYSPSNHISFQWKFIKKKISKSNT